MANLVNNAINYAPSSINIHVTVTKTGKFAKITIRDEEPGIGPQNLPRIFNTFGFGFDLYIISEIIKQHRGDVGAKSEV